MIACRPTTSASSSCRWWRRCRWCSSISTGADEDPPQQPLRRDVLPAAAAGAGHQPHRPGAAADPGAARQARRIDPGAAGRRAAGGGRRRCRIPRDGRAAVAGIRGAGRQPGDRGRGRLRSGRLERAAWADGAGILPAPLRAAAWSAVCPTKPPAPCNPSSLDFDSLVHDYFLPEGTSPEELKSMYGPPALFFKAVAADAERGDRAAGGRGGQRVLRRTSAAAWPRSTASSRSWPAAKSKTAAADSQDDQRAELQRQRGTLAPHWLLWQPQQDDEGLPPVKELAERAGPRCWAASPTGCPSWSARQWGRGQVLFVSSGLSPGWNTLPMVGKPCWSTTASAASMLLETFPPRNLSTEQRSAAGRGRRAHRRSSPWSIPTATSRPLSVDALERRPLRDYAGQLDAARHLPRDGRQRREAVGRRRRPRARLWDVPAGGQRAGRRVGPRPAAADDVGQGRPARASSTSRRPAPRRCGGRRRRAVEMAVGRRAGRPVAGVGHRWHGPPAAGSGRHELARNRDRAARDGCWDWSRRRPIDELAGDFRRALGPAFARSGSCSAAWRWRPWRRCSTSAISRAGAAGRGSCWRSFRARGAVPVAVAAGRADPLGHRDQPQAARRCGCCSTGPTAWPSTTSCRRPSGRLASWPRPLAAADPRPRLRPGGRPSRPQPSRIDYVKALVEEGRRQPAGGGWARSSACRRSCSTARRACGRWSLPPGGAGAGRPSTWPGS